MPEPRRRRAGPHAPGPDGDAPAEQARAVAWANRFGVVLLLGVVLGFVTLPWPLPLLSGVLCAVALVLGTVALVRLRRTRVRGALVPVVISGMVLALVLAVASLTQAVFWQEYSTYAGCVRSALTEQARDRCTAQLENALDERLRRMQEVVEQG